MKSVINGSKKKSAVLWALIVLNVLLVAALVTRHTPENKAMAAGGRVGDVLAVPGALPGFSNGVVFLVDTTNQQMTVISVDTANRNNSDIQAMRPLDLNKLLNATGGVRGK